MKYVKLNLTFGDKLKLMFFDIISEDRLPTIEVVKEVQVNRITEKAPSKDIIKHSDNINIKDEEEFHVPFFELNDGDVKSNF